MVLNMTIGPKRASEAEGRIKLSNEKFLYVVLGCNFSPEHGENMFLRNVGIYLRVLTESEPKHHYHHHHSRGKVKFHTEASRFTDKVSIRHH
jgi:hypothetical protein